MQPDSHIAQSFPLLRQVALYRTLRSLLDCGQIQVLSVFIGSDGTRCDSRVNRTTCVAPCLMLLEVNRERRNAHGKPCIRIGEHYSSPTGLQRWPVTPRPCPGPNNPPATPSYSGASHWTLSSFQSQPTHDTAYPRNYHVIPWHHKMPQGSHFGHASQGHIHEYYDEEGMNCRTSRDEEDEEDQEDNFGDVEYEDGEDNDNNNNGGDNGDESEYQNDGSFSDYEGYHEDDEQDQ